MNLRISEGQLRFRITQEEIDSLMKENVLSFALRLGTQAVEYSIALTEDKQPLKLEARKHAWKLLVNRKDLQSFSASLPSREGLEHQVELGGAPLKLALEVDIRHRREV